MATPAVRGAGLLTLAIALGVPAPTELAVAAPPPPGAALQVTTERTTVAVLALANKTGKQDWDYIGPSVAQIVTTNLSRNRGVRVVLRDQLDRVMKELRLSAVGAVDEASALRIGKLLGARFVVVGGVVRFGAMFRIDANLVDVQTGEVSTSETVSGRKESDLLRMSDELSMKLLNAIVPPEPARTQTPAATPQVQSATTREWLSVMTRLSPTLKSLVLPGWGQISDGRPIRGVVFGALVASAVSVNIYEYRLREAAYRRYQLVNDEGNIERERQMRTGKAHERLMNISAGLALAAWTGAVFDAALRRKGSPIKGRFTPVGVEFSCSW